MGNKISLQAHNVDLQTAVNKILTMPTSVPWGGGSTDIVAGDKDIVIPAYTDKELVVKAVAGGLKPEDLGFTKMTYGEFVLANEVAGAKITHGLGEIPKALIILGEGASPAGINFYSAEAFIFKNNQNNTNTFSGGGSGGKEWYGIYDYQSFIFPPRGDMATDTEITVGLNSTITYSSSGDNTYKAASVFVAGAKYRWIALA